MYIPSLNICTLSFYCSSRPLFFFFSLAFFFFSSFLFASFFSSPSVVSPPLCQALFYSLNASCAYLPSSFFSSLLLNIVLHIRLIIINFFSSFSFTRSILTEQRCSIRIFDSFIGQLVGLNII